jgi:hypothetical protein
MVTPVFTRLARHKLSACLAAAMLAVACPTALLAQSPCEQAVEDFRAKVDPASAAFEALEKLKAGPAACNEAKRVQALLATLAKQGDETTARCAGHDPESFTHLRLKFNIARIGSKNTFIEDDVAKLCRTRP